MENFPSPQRGHAAQDPQCSSSHNLIHTCKIQQQNDKFCYDELLTLFFLLQDQFLLDGSSDSGMWIVPITLGCNSHDMQKRFLLKHKFSDIKGINSQYDDQDRQNSGNFWIKLNIDETGFYRVKYDDELTTALRNALQMKKLSLMDKIGRHKHNMAQLVSITIYSDLVTGIITLLLQASWKMHMLFLLLASKHCRRYYIYCMLAVTRMISVFFHT